MPPDRSSCNAPGVRNSVPFPRDPRTLPKIGHLLTLKAAFQRFRANLRDNRPLIGVWPVSDPDLDSAIPLPPFRRVVGSNRKICAEIENIFRGDDNTDGS